MLPAIKNNGYSLRFASKSLKNNKEFMLEIVKNDGYSLKFASE